MAEQSARLVKLASMWQRKSAAGKTYFSGFLGDAQLLLFKQGEKDHPTREGEKVTIWHLLVQERDASRRPKPKPDLHDAAVAASAPPQGGDDL